MPEVSHSLRALKEIGDISDQGLVLYDLKTQTVIYSNIVASRLVGVDVNASLADIRKLLEQVMPEDRHFVIAQFKQASGRSITHEFKIHTIVDGKKRAAVCCKTYVVADNSVVVVFIRDISKERQHESYLVEFGVRKNTVLDTLAHTISGALNLMQNLSTEAEKRLQPSGDDSLKKYLQLVNENSRQCLEVIGGVINHEHLKSPEIYPKAERFNLVEKLGFIYEELSHGFPDRKFVFDYPSENLYITSDEVKVLQVVNNFASNAIKFSPASEPIVISIDERDSRVIVSVRDTGIGIPEELKPLIFERQAGKGRRGLNGERSSGIGLWICKNLIDMIGGEIWFDSKEGEGSVFYFSLPKESES